jgi:hypothetical protein
MPDSSSHPDSTGNPHPDIEAMYQSFMATNELLKSSQHILDLATHLTGAENCSLMLLNGHGELYMLNARGLSGANLRASRIKLGEGVAGQVAMQGQSLLVENISSDARFSAYRRDRYLTESFIACPITASEKVIGVLNLTDKHSGEPFNPADLDQAKLVSAMAEMALRSFLGNRRFNLENGDLDDMYRRLVEAEYNGREFVARISHDFRDPLQHIKGAVYTLRNLASADPHTAQECYEIIEKEVNYLISYVGGGHESYEQMQVWLDEIEEREKYKNLLE